MRARATERREIRPAEYASHPRPPAGTGDLGKEAPKLPPRDEPEREPRNKPPAGPSDFPIPDRDQDVNRSRVRHRPPDTLTKETT